ncbi:Nitrogen assimilation transcription factor nirA [Paramyrothecium foliicola]|nr:Nitrogen assimilation transcription factor nirA [Paramyrothecium foliicola]
MDRLPPELIRKILQELDPHDLKIARLVKKQYAALATPLLFTTLEFFGPDHLDGPWRHSKGRRPKWSVEFSKLHEIVAEVLPIVRGTRKLVFAPAYYRNGFWNDYSAYLEAEMDEIVDEYQISDSDGSDGGSDDSSEDDISECPSRSYEHRIQAVVNRRRARPDSERKLILEATDWWEAKILEQNTNRNKVEASLQDLFHHATILEEIDIQVWGFEDVGELRCLSSMLDGFRSDPSPTMHHLETLSRSLHQASRFIKKLRVDGFNPNLLQDSPALRHTFSDLRHLRLGIGQADSLLEDSASISALPKALKAAENTLEHLELGFGGETPWLPDRGVHLLDKVFRDEETGTSLAFPNLQSFHLSSLLVSSTSLIGFLAAQPKVSTLVFSYIYLVTAGVGWEQLANAIPDSVETWEVFGRLGQEPVAGFEPPIAYNWCTDWRFDQESLPRGTGWKAETIGPARCDGIRPVCGSCSHRAVECKYAEGPSKRKPPSKLYTQTLEAKVASLEEQIARLMSERSELAHSPKAATSDRYEPPSLTATATSASLNDEQRENISENELAEMLGSFNLDDGGELRYFGACSNFHLVQHKNAFKDASSSTARQEGNEAANRAFGPLDMPRDLRNHLLDLFWSWQNSWQYVVARDIFLADLDANKSTRFCSPLLLAAIYAIASRYSDRPEVRTDTDDPETAGAMYAARAKVMLQHEWQAPTVSTVQATALLALYSAGVNQESLGWMYSGIAVRLAFTLGLHLDCSHYVQQGIITTRDLEYRNVAWWGVFVLDNLFTLGHGRPSGITDQDITAPAPSSGAASSGPPNYLPSATDCYLYSQVTTTAFYTYELIRSSRVLHRLYAVNPGWTPSERKRHVIEAQLQLSTLYETLPPMLRLPVEQNKPSPPQVYILHLQYHVTIILLHRPFFPAFRGAAKSALMKGSYEENLHARACKASAQRIRAITKAFKTHYTLRYVPLSGVHCVFTATVIHLLDLMYTEGIAHTRARAQIRDCLDSLQEMSKTWSWSGRCLRSVLSLATEWKVDIGSSRWQKAPALTRTSIEENLYDVSSATDAGQDAFMDISMLEDLQRWMGDDTSMFADLSVGMPGLDAFGTSFIDNLWHDTSID